MGQVRLVLPLSAAFVLLLAGCERTQLVQSYDAGIVCGQNERFMNGECTFVCSRDSDCATDQVCNLFTGTCEAAPAIPDGGTLTFPCTTGATRCRADNLAVESCTEAGTWVATEECAADGFCQNEQCLACQPGVTRCDPNDLGKVQACPDDGSGWQTITCANNATCLQGECRECAPNTSRCSPDGKNVQTCSKLGEPDLTWGWANSGDNFDGTCITQQCLDTSPPMCKAPDCIPGATRCSATDPLKQEVCSPTGSWSTVSCVSAATPNGVCTNGVCVDECAEAAKQNSYFGCEYWSAIQDNSVDPFFKGFTLSGQGTTDSDFAFAIANRSTTQATVKIYRKVGGSEVLLKTVTVDPKNSASKGLTVVKVPWQSIGPASAAVGVAQTGKQPYAYRITSTRPVTVYQFSPLDADLTQTFTTSQSCWFSFECTDYSGGTCNSNGYCKYNNAQAYSYSNDASLLLPAHILSDQYVAVSHPHMVFANNSNSAPTGDGNGNIAIVATQDNTTVQIKSSAKTVAGGGIAAMNKGQTATFTLNRYDVLQIATANLGSSYIECAHNPFDQFGSTVSCRVDNDLTGTVVTSVDATGKPDPTKPVAVFGGAACAIMPHSAGACDHVEEQVFPFSTWGKTFVATKSHPVRLTNGNFASTTQMSPDYYKVVASCPTSQCPNGTTLTFNSTSGITVMQPNRCLGGTSIAANNCRLAGGSYMEFYSKKDFTIAGDYPIAVAQIFAGEDATSGGAAQGDPSLILLPPVEQWRSEYTVQAAPGLADNFLAISIDSTKVLSVSVDGTSVTGFASVTGTNFQTVNYPVSVGVHTIQVAPKPGQTSVPGAGVVVYGFDSYVSYGYTGGLDLGSIVSGIDPGG